MTENTSARASGKARFETLDDWEMPMVRRQVAAASRPAVRSLAVAINHLGNGWIYIPLALIVFATQGWDALRVAWAAVTGALIAHCVYPTIKTYIARPRPIDRDPTLTRTVIAPLDAYSFPSGHCMTAMTAVIPLSIAYPGTILPLSGAVLLIGWARLALGHHYPSDLIFGAALGAAISVPVSWYFLS
jgi:undecaprenyl-diphosphatase